MKVYGNNMQVCSAVLKLKFVWIKSGGGGFDFFGHSLSVLVILKILIYKRLACSKLLSATSKIHFRGLQ